MKIVDETIRRLTISDVAGLDPIRVMLEDIGPGQGRINIECWGKAWACYWGAMGNETLAQFFVSSDEHYLAGKLSDIPASVFNPDGLRDLAVKSIIKDRRKWHIGRDEARRQYDEAESLRNIETESDAWNWSDLLVTFFGDDWHYAMPTKENPDYAYLRRIIRAVQEGLKSLNNSAACPFCGSVDQEKTTPKQRAEWAAQAQKISQDRFYVGTISDYFAKAVLALLDDLKGPSR